MTNEDAAKRVVACLGLLLFVPAWMFEGVVLCWLWSWYVVPLGVVQLTVPWAMGIGMLVGILGFSPFALRDDEMTLLEGIGKGLWAWSVIWGLGALLHAFM